MAAEDPRAVLRRYGLRPKKSWGQNFLVNRALADRMASTLAEAGVSDAIEIGAGLGTLTAALAENLRTVTAIERDPELVAVLREELPNLGQNVVIVEADAATFDYDEVASGGTTAIVGNLPYNISGRLLRRIIEMRGRLELALVMVQREVAKRLLAEPSSSDYGVLSVMCQSWLTPELMWRVSPGSFYPQPGVSSAVVRLTATDEPRAGELDEEHLGRVVHAAFSARRKTLKNTLSSSFDRAEVMAALKAEDIDPGRRAETLSVEQLAALAKRL
jgi:16S rRNA (adenine1518-N6/adenine1519-N6)-dimethyltransferase